jgi:Tol biopolymer transport system component
MVVLKNKALRTIMLAVALAAGLLAAGLLALVEPAQATFPGDNGRIAFSSNRGADFQIYSVSSTGTEVDLNPVTTQLSGNDENPVYSPDGTKIAFQRTVGGDTDIWTISATGGTNPNRITSDPAFDNRPSWQSLPTSGK